MTKKPVVKKPAPLLKPEEILFKSRNVFLSEGVTDKTADVIIKQLLALDEIKVAPIKFWLNSPGGSCCAGLAIIEVMKQIKSKVITIINSEVCSMGGHISVAGDERWIVPTGVFMAHDMAGGIGGDYSLKVKDRAIFMEQYYSLLENNLRKHTNLSEEQLLRARTGELWLFASDCIQYGVVDKILYQSGKKS